MADFNFMLVLPVVCLAAYALLSLLLIPLVRGNSRALAVVCLIGLGMTGFTLYRLWALWRSVGPMETAYGMVRIDGFGLLFSFVLLLIAILSVLVSMTFLEREQADRGEFYALIMFCLAGMFLIALPSLWTGITERNHMYVNWPKSHRIKLVLSVLLVVLLSIEIGGILASEAPLRLGSWLGMAVVVLNCVVVFLLSAFGLRITLGRQSFGRTSYVPDMDFDPPMNILDCVADFAGEPPKLIDVREER